MTLAYADHQLPSASPYSRPNMWIGSILIVLFLPSAVLCYRAIRWDRWANYGSNDRRWWKNLPGDSGASYNAWYAWRSSRAWLLPRYRARDC